MSELDTSSPRPRSTELSTRRGWRGWLDRVLFPVHWSFLLSQVALWSFLLLTVTGIYLALFYRPGLEPVLYGGGAVLYTGAELPEAFASTLTLSADVPFGGVARRLHVVATLIFIASLVAHLVRVLLMGAFRRPRRVNYLLGGLVLLLALVTAYTGHLLPFDMIAGASAQIAVALISSLPLVGERLAPLLFGSPVAESGEVFTRAWVLHLFVLSPLLVAGIVLHLVGVNRQRHTRLPEHAASRTVGVRSPLSRCVLLGLLTTGILLASAALVPWGAVRLSGPFQPGHALNNMAPDWYLSWAQGVMLLLSAIHDELGPVVVTNVLVGGVLLPSLVVLLPLLYPWIEPWWRRQAPSRPDLAQHPFADPVRFGLVIAWLTGAAVVVAGAAAPAIVGLLAVPLELFVTALRAALLVGPLAAGFLAWGYARAQKPRWMPPQHSTRHPSRPVPTATGESQET